MLLLGQDYNKMSCFKTWPVLSWIRKTIFFLMPNLTSGIMINYCIHFFLQSIKIWWQLEIGHWVLTILTSLCQYRIPSYSQVGVPLLRILTAIFRDKEFAPAIHGQGGCSLLRSQLLRVHGTCSPALPLAPSLSRHQKQGPGHTCMWLGSQ